MTRKTGFLPWLALSIFLITGIMVYDDYGIAWDEYFQYKENGEAVWNHVKSGDFESYKQNSEKYHGPAFELLLVAAEKLTGITDSRDIYLQRHLISFLFFWLSGFALLLLLRKRYSNNLLITLGICWYFLMPRVFADSFYNSKDIPFMAMNMICLYSMYNLLEKQNIKWSVLHGLFCGFTIAIRVMGIIIPILTITALFILLFNNKTNLKKIGSISMITGLITIASMVAFWPILWLNPVLHFLHAISEMSKYPWDANVLFEGVYYPSNELPWYYVIKWIVISTPVLYLILFFVSLVFLVADSRSIKKIIEHHFDWILVALTLLPVFSVIVLHSIIYDAWRHLFFIFAPMSVLMVSGLNQLLGSLSSIRLRTLIYFFVIALTLPTGYWMIKWHPYQNVYFNCLAGTDRQDIARNYEMDYWGTSYRQTLEKLAQRKPSGPISVYSANAPGIMNSWIFEKELRNRFNFVTDMDSAEYLITIYRWEINKSEAGMLWDSILVDGIRISGTYKITTTK